jgi:hypothetical protein
VKTYADTSYLFSLYAADANSSRADVWRLANPDPLPFTPLHRLEFRNALGLALFQKRMTAAEMQAVWQAVENDLTAGFLVEQDGSWHRVFPEAETAAMNQTPSIGCRTLDILHVATAKILGLPEFCTFDTRQSTLAFRMGMTPASL